MCSKPHVNKLNSNEAINQKLKTSSQLEKFAVDITTGEVAHLSVKYKTLTHLTSLVETDFAHCRASHLFFLFLSSSSLQ